MNLDVVTTELTFALRACREHMRQRADDKQTLDHLCEAVGKIELALELLRAVRQV